MGTRGSFPGSRATGTWSWPLTSSPPSWRGASLKRKHRDNFTFTVNITRSLGPSEWSLFSALNTSSWNVIKSNLETAPVNKLCAYDFLLHGAPVIELFVRSTYLKRQEAKFLYVTASVPGECRASYSSSVRHSMRNRHKWRHICNETFSCRNTFSIFFFPSSSSSSSSSSPPYSYPKYISLSSLSNLRLSIPSSFFFTSLS
jgi:hypothetical protein